MEPPDRLEPDERADESQARGAPGRGADMAIPFAVYLFVIVAGIASYVVVGLTHH